MFDLAGSVDDFHKAVSHVPGLEYLLEMDEEKSAPDELFHTETNEGPTNKPVQRTVHVVMSDAAAAQQLVSLFDTWQTNPSVTLERGLAPLKRVFAQLRDVRPWSAQDRVRETGLLEQWRDDLAAAGPYVSFKRVEIELWFRQSVSLRTAAESIVRTLVVESGGTVVTSTVISGAGYHAILADIPIQKVEQVVADGANQLAVLTTDAVMFVSPFRPMSFEPASDVEQIVSSTPISPDNSPPRVALLDGLPIANHPHLVGRVLVDDPDDLTPSYPIPSRTHGTAMASLIIRGDLHDQTQNPARRIYARPILVPHEFNERHEVSMSDVLFPDLLHRAIRRMVAGENDTPAAAPSVRIVNLSIGDDSKAFIDRMSPAARVIDWLSYTYNLLIVVSAGNHSYPPLEVSRESLSDITQMRSAARRAAFASARHRGLLSPAEAINALTVGAVHTDSSEADLPDTVIDPTQDGSPALYSALGLGYRRSVKPEVFMSGGRSTYLRPVGDSPSARLDLAQPGATGPGHLVAAPTRAGVEVGISYTHGSSNAAALATRAANEIFEILEDPSRVDAPFPWPDAQYHPVVTKALLVHSARWGAMKDHMISELGDTHDTSRSSRNLTKLLGYGRVSFDQVLSALSNRAMVVGAGSLRPDQRQTFNFPLPEDLRASAAWRRLTITLAWFTPVDAKSRKYRGTKLKFEAPKLADIGATPSEAEHWTTRMGTVQHQVLEGTGAVAFSDDGTISINVDSQVDATKFREPVRFGLVASLEVAPETSVAIFDQIRAGLQVQARARATAQVRAR
ncbi:S8 family peptidase [Rathayibacter sp. VKM Ac-2926]|uniref:S8 family peptidase n=1 Tax=Rathayibacter sp. VKM Ac-2926 TaxID=2929477 RepID=UPI001FB4B2A2|nr:S8 family peptidase [Rathayibacter sp. VKM Ac-2926]